MLYNYLIISLRNLVANALYSALNIVGLAMGLATCLLIICFVAFETSYDKELKDVDRTYRLSRHYAAEDMHLAAVAAPFTPLLTSRFDDIESIGQLGLSSSIPMSQGDFHAHVDDVLMADSAIFSALPLEFIKGDAKHALDKINTIVLTESAAKRFFGDQEAFGNTLMAYEVQPLEVTGIIKDLPQNSHLNFSMLLALENMRRYVPEDFDNWDFNNFYTYVRLKPGVDKQQLESKFPALLQELGEDIAKDQSLSLQPVRDIHLHSNKMYEMKRNGSFVLVASFAAVALIILLIACINFMNLSTAQASKRAKEVGMRKTVGASQSQLIFQFISESTLLSLFSMLLALAFVELTLPIFSSFIQRPLDISIIYSPAALCGLILSIIVVGCFSGSYPAFYLAAFKPTQVLKGQKHHGLHALNLRKILVTIQFSLSIGLIIATTVVVQQVAFARDQDPGYNKDHNVVISLSYAQGFGDRNAMYRVLRERLLQNPDIVSVAAAQQLPTIALRDIWSYVPEGKNIVADTMVALPTLNAGYRFFEHYQIPLLAGRYFSEDRGDQFVQVPTNANPVGSGIAVISRAAAKALNYSPEEAVNKIIKIPFPPGSTNYRIVGVVEDVQFGSLRDEPKPQVYHLVKNEERFVSIRIKPKRLKPALKFIEDTWKGMVPNRPISQTLLDDNFNAMYRAEDKQAQVFALFSLLAIAIACMGLFGLAAFTADSRKKEIGIRKSLGASVFDIVKLLTRDFSLLVLIANALAWPVTYIVMQNWLSGFHKSIDLSPWIFINAGFIALVIAWITVASHAMRSAMMRPIHSLRYE
ncbi:ABC transporter permease [Agaribacterium sp. ZY112]|uniref:ABC transporter permease n=1 Tax=Agaribacterium sp. ZY112 TaxID=3233574 RepID=UPI003526B2B4